MVDPVFRQRKFGFAVFFSIIGTIFLAVGKLTGGEWVTLVTIILGLYSAANVSEKVFNK